MYLKLDIDGADGKALHPYPWIPPTGNVMYCMPQEGTEAYLYFPEAEEESAYAVSEIHNSRCPVFADAQRRELVTEHGKKLRLHADMLGFAGGKEETVQECRMREDGIHFGAGRGKLQVTGREQILFHAPEISLDAVQKIGQYKMESMAKEKAGMLYPRGGGNPATGGLAAAGLYQQCILGVCKSGGILHSHNSGDVRGRGDDVDRERRHGADPGGRNGCDPATARRCIPACGRNSHKPEPSVPDEGSTNVLYLG